MLSEICVYDLTKLPIFETIHRSIQLPPINKHKLTISPKLGSYIVYLCDIILLNNHNYTPISLYYI